MAIQSQKMIIALNKQNLNQIKRGTLKQNLDFESPSSTETGLIRTVPFLIPYS